MRRVGANHRREQRWADLSYKKRALGTAFKSSPFGGSSHAKGIVLEKVGVEAKGLLAGKGVTVSEINVEDDAKFRQEMLAKSGGRRTVPQIFIGDRHVGGCDDLFELERSGELDRLLQGA